jgi:hypothetical protein
MPEHHPELPEHHPELPEHILCRSASGTAALHPELPEHILRHSSIRNCRNTSYAAQPVGAPSGLPEHILYAAQPPELPEHPKPHSPSSFVCGIAKNCRFASGTAGTDLMPERHPELPFCIRNCRNRSYAGTPSGTAVLHPAAGTHLMPFTIRYCRLIIYRSPCNNYNHVKQSVKCQRPVGGCRGNVEDRVAVQADGAQRNLGAGGEVPWLGAARAQHAQLAGGVVGRVVGGVVERVVDGVVGRDGPVRDAPAIMVLRPLMRTNTPVSRHLVGGR